MKRNLSLIGSSTTRNGKIWTKRQAKVRPGGDIIKGLGIDSTERVILGCILSRETSTAWVVPMIKYVCEHIKHNDSKLELVFDYPFRSRFVVSALSSMTLTAI